MKSNLHHLSGQVLVFAAISLTFPCFLLQERRKEEVKGRRDEEEMRKISEEDVKRRREEEVKRRREVVARICKQSKVTSTTTSEEEESNGRGAGASRSRKFLNLFANNSGHYSATGLYILHTWFKSNTITSPVAHITTLNQLKLPVSQTNRLTSMISENALTTCNC